MSVDYATMERGTLERLLQQPFVGDVARERIRAELDVRPTAPRRQKSPVAGAGRPPQSPLTEAVRLVLYGVPRTKKTSNRVVFRRGKPKVLPSAAWCAWLDSLRSTGQLPGLSLPDQPYRCTAVFFRDRASGDLVGFQQGLADVLEKGGILSNDRYILSWDGTRLAIDRACPRVELVLTPMEVEE